MKTNSSTIIYFGFLAITTIALHAAAPLKVYPPSTSPPAGYHVDALGIDIIPGYLNRPIASMTLDVVLYGLSQINPGGVPTVFANSTMDSTLMAQDSHFLIDSAQISVLSQSESDKQMSASIVFNQDVVFSTQGRLPVAQAIGRNGHANPDGSYYDFRYSGVFVDGGAFGGGFSGIPEPSILTYLTFGMLVIGMFHFKHKLN